MLLKDYLFEQGISIQGFARRLKVTRVHMSTIVNGRSTTSLKLAAKIVKETDGLVTYDQFLSEKNLRKQRLLELGKSFKKCIRKMKRTKQVLTPAVNVNLISSGRPFSKVDSFEVGSCYLTSAISHYKENNSVAKN